MIRIHHLLALAAAAAVPLHATAQQSYPAKPVRLIVPSPPGSIADFVARSVGQELSTRLGQPWVIDNRPGANQVIGIDACAKAAGDGYTTCLVSIDTMSLNPLLMANLPYDAVKDFKPVSNLFYITQGLIAAASVPASSTKELQALAAAKPGSLNFSTLGAGTNPDVFRHWLSEKWKSGIVGVPYKGGILAANAVVSGEVQLSWIGIGNIVGQAQAGKVKILTVNSARRSRAFPNVPTLKEVGLEEFAEKVWWGLSAPAATPEAIIARLNKELARAYQEPKFLGLLEGRFLEPAYTTAEAFVAFMKADRERAARVIKAFNVPKQ